jgi:hypothetical protein
MSRIFTFGKTNNVNLYDVHQRVEITSIRKDFDRFARNKRHYAKFVYKSPNTFNKIPIGLLEYNITDESKFLDALKVFQEIAKVPYNGNILIEARRDCCKETNTFSFEGLPNISDWRNYSAKTVGFLNVSKHNVMGGAIEIRYRKKSVIKTITKLDLSPANLVIYEGNNMEYKLGSMCSFDKREDGFRDTIIFIYSM